MITAARIDRGGANVAETNGAFRYRLTLWVTCREISRAHEITMFSTGFVLK